MVRSRSGLLVALGIGVGLAGCAGQADVEQPSTDASIDLAEAVELIAESAGSDQIQSLRMSTSNNDVVARMVVAGQLSTWSWDGDGEPTPVDINPRDYQRWPQSPTDPTAIVQAVLTLPECPEGTMEATALPGDVVQVQVDCRSGGAEDRQQRTYLGGEEVTAESLHLTDPDQLTAAVAQALAMLEDPPVAEVAVTLGREPELLVRPAEPTPTLAGENGSCLPYLELRADSNGLPEQWYGCTQELEVTELAEPFHAELALEVSERIEGAERVSLRQESDLPVYHVDAAAGSYPFDVAGTPLFRGGTIETPYEPGTYTPVAEVAEGCRWAIMSEDGVRVDSGEADSGRPQVALEAGQDFSVMGCGFWQLT
ncbi:hypothetical protein [Ruania zhangjianzhongii]|uniref:hypothetical protein n=1 Tax=Ruania zhangjianzhongii TaxID=2603206 RepID=UPI0011CB1CD6|nr:hypothetical protein [Ruania zhangjianzhongii]